VRPRTLAETGLFVSRFTVRHSGDVTMLQPRNHGQDTLALSMVRGLGLQTIPRTTDKTQSHCPWFVQGLDLHRIPRTTDKTHSHCLWVESWICSAFHEPRNRHTRIVCGSEAGSTAHFPHHVCNVRGSGLLS